MCLCLCDTCKDLSKGPFISCRLWFILSILMILELMTMNNAGNYMHVAIVVLIACYSFPITYPFSMLLGLKAIEPMVSPFNPAILLYLLSASYLLN